MGNLPLNRMESSEVFYTYQHLNSSQDRLQGSLSGPCTASRATHQGFFFPLCNPLQCLHPTGRGRAMVRGQFNPRQCLQPTGRGRATVRASFLCTGHHEGPRGQACQKSKPRHCTGDLRNESITALRRAVPSALSPRLQREWSAGACLS